jgi:5-methylcytosine-specific restriction endonuclease McrA
MLCKNCNKETQNPKFCSLSCSASYNNRVNPKRKRNPKYRCKCGKRKKYSALLCRKCRTRENEKTPIKDLYYGNDANKYAGIRGRARTTFFNNNKIPLCKICGYDKHVEVCHIKAINEFSDDTPIGIVNSLNNLIGLCPNCHWEYDHGLLL